jgi:hypothetical protein
MDAIKELWGLRVNGGDGTEGGGLVRAIDEAGDPILCYLTEKDAHQGAEAHREMYFIDCTPVRVRVP